MSNKFVRFLLVGATNTLISYFLFLFLLSFMRYLPAYSIAYCAGIILSYFLNAFFVFRKQTSLRSFLIFPAVYVIQYVSGASILWFLVGNVYLAPPIAIFVTMGSAIPIAYLTSCFIFNNYLDSHTKCNTD